MQKSSGSLWMKWVKPTMKEAVVREKKKKIPRSKLWLQDAEGTVGEGILRGHLTL